MGGILVKLKSNNDQISITVEDSGKGIVSEDLSHIFYRCYSCDKNCTFESTGLGLSFSRAHGGDIAIKSTPNIGGTFVIPLLLKPQYF